MISRYRNGERRYEPGQEIHVSDDEGEYLLRDSPGSFTTDDVPRAEIPSVDRRARGGRVR